MTATLPRRASLVFGLLFALSSGGSLWAAPFSDRLLRDESQWGDGQAEITIFSVTEKRYGIARETEVRHILVREHFAANERVKADDWRAPGAYAVFKLNQIITVPTGTYRYDQGHSSFWRADTGELIKFSQTTNDSCGLAYKQGDRETGDRWRYRVLTYWEGMSEIDRRVSPPAATLFYDELPFRLRLLDWKNDLRFTSPLISSVIGSKADDWAAPTAEFTVQRIAEEWRVTVVHARGRDIFYYDGSSPHALRRWERWDGTALERRRTVRLPYWQLNRSGDERRLQAPYSGSSQPPRFNLPSGHPALRPRDAIQDSSLRATSATARPLRTPPTTPAPQAR